MGHSYDRAGDWVYHCLLPLGSHSVRGQRRLGIGVTQQQTSYSPSPARRMQVLQTNHGNENWPIALQQHRGLLCMTTSQKYRRFAQECLEMARSFKDEGTRATLLLMAQVWLRLAEQMVSSGTDEKV
jgi:hypothetical protein